MRRDADSSIIIYINSMQIIIIYSFFAYIFFAMATAAVSLAKIISLRLAPPMPMHSTSYVQSGSWVQFTVTSLALAFYHNEKLCAHVQVRYTKNIEIFPAWANPVPQHPKLHPYITLKAPVLEVVRTINVDHAKVMSSALLQYSPAYSRRWGYFFSYKLEVALREDVW